MSNDLRVDLSSHPWMRSRAAGVAAILLLAAVFARAESVTGGQIDAIEQMGRLNGVALQCGHVRQTRRIKSALVAALPKQRQLGRVFEEATNRSFLESMNGDAGCPAEEDLAREIETGIDALHGAFGS